MISLTGRLICASNMAYSVKKDGTVPSCPPYDIPVGFKKAPTAFVDGPDAINACFVGTNDDGVILSFRGTLPMDSPNHEQTLLDWLNDLDALLVTKPGIPGSVHQGFWDAVESLWPQIILEVKKQLDKSSAKKLIITGHSKGGPMANIAAIRFAVEENIPSTVCTFAAAHPGDVEFANAYNKNQMITGSTRYEYADDIVPHLPPGITLCQMLSKFPIFSGFCKKYDYVPVGVLRFINWDGDVVGDSLKLEAERIYHLASLLFELKFDQIIHDHSISCGSGYMSAICSTRVCP